MFDNSVIQIFQFNNRSSIIPRYLMELSQVKGFLLILMIGVYGINLPDELKIVKLV